MNNEEKILQVLQSLTEGQKQLFEGQNRLEKKVDDFKAQFEEHEAKDASRHIEMMSEIKELRKDINAVEIVTAKNWRDIADLKIVK